MFSGYLWRPRDWKLWFWTIQNLCLICSTQHQEKLDIAEEKERLETFLASWSVCHLCVLTSIIFLHKSNTTSLETPPASHAAMCSCSGSMMRFLPSEDSSSVTLLVQRNRLLCERWLVFSLTVLEMWGCFSMIHSSLCILLLWGSSDIAWAFPFCAFNITRCENAFKAWSAKCKPLTPILINNHQLSEIGQ